VAQTTSRDVRISVRNLWKVYGPHASSLLSEEWVHEASRREVQERTGHVIGVRNVSFDVHEGEVFVVMGLSGSGKSTLVRCLIRLIEPTQGVIEVDGEDVTGYSDSQLIHLRRAKVGMVFQHYGLMPHRRVLDNVAYGLEVQGIDKATRYKKAREVVERVGLEGWEESYPGELSGGMQQRVGIARALAVDPPILLMDEPFSGLDPLIRREMQDEMVTLLEQIEKTIVFITHDLNEALKLGDRIAIMRDGEVIQVGTPEEIVMLPADAYVSEFARDVSKGQNDASYTPKQACAYETLPIDKGMNKGLTDKAPDVVEMLRKMDVGLQPINTTAAWAVDADIQGNWEKAAVYYLENYESRWTSWMPEDNVEKVKDALEAMTP